MSFWGIFNPASQQQGQAGQQQQGLLGSAQQQGISSGVAIGMQQQGYQGTAGSALTFQQLQQSLQKAAGITSFPLPLEWGACPLQAIQCTNKEKEFAAEYIKNLRKNPYYNLVKE